MATGNTKEISSVEKMTKQEMSKIIKDAKRESDSTGEENISICDIMKNNTSEIIRRMESKFPSYAQLYIDLYTKYLHSINDLYSTCYLSEKEFFDELGINKTTVQAFDTYWKSVTNMSTFQIDMAEKFAKMYVQFRLDTINSYDKVIHQMMDTCARAWNQINSSEKKQL